MRQSCGVNERLKEVRELYRRKIDPGKNTTILGGALQALKEVLDPKRSDSVQGVIDAAVRTVTGEDGRLAKAVKAVVADAVKPLADEVDKLAKDFGVARRRPRR